MDYNFKRQSLADICLGLQEQGAYNINLVTPTHYTIPIINEIRSAKKRELVIPVVWNTSGYELPKTIELLDGIVDVYLTDFKYFGSEAASSYSNAPDYFEHAAAALEVMVKQNGKAVFDSDGMIKSGVVVRHLALPGHLSDSCKVLEYIYRKYGDNIFISIMNQYTPQPDVDYGKFPELKNKVSARQYKQLVNFAVNLGITNAFIQGGAAVSESFIPNF